MKIILLILIAISTTSYAKNLNQKQAVATKMLNTINKNKNVDKILNGMVKMQINQNPMLKMNKNKVTNFYLKHASFTKLKPKLASLYAKELSVEEMKALTNFFKTKEGQKILLKMPRLMQLSTNLGQQEVFKHYGELMNSLMSK